MIGRRLSIADPAGSPQPILGLASLGNLLWTSGRRRQLDAAALDRAYGEGYRVVDTAPIYGLGASEKALGSWMKLRRNREHIVVITKAGHPRIWRPRKHRITVDGIAEDLTASLRRLQTDYIDLYLLHRDAPECDLPAIMQYLHEQQRRGVVHMLGVSNWHHARIAEANSFARQRGLTEFAVSSPQLSLLTWTRPPWSGCASISGSEGATAREWYRENRLPVLAWSPLGGGVAETPGAGWAASGACYSHAMNNDRLSRAAAIARTRGVSVQQILLSYLASLPFLVHPICASRNRDHLRANRAALDVKLSEEEIRSLEGD